MRLIPAILVKTEADFLQQTHAVEAATDLVHLDLADGQFVSETTWSDPDFVTANLHTACELHLMVKDPLAAIAKWQHVPQIKRILFHVESTENIMAVISAIRAEGWAAVAVLNPETPSSTVNDVAHDLAGVMAMTIHPGAQGRAFMPEVLPKLSTLKQAHPHLITQVDGGVNRDTLPLLKQADVDLACVGSAVFGHGEPAENLANLKKLID